MAETLRAGDDLESSDEKLYFLAIEKVFIEERGSPLYLSPKDWQVALKWYEQGVPLDWVEGTLHEIFEQRRAKGTAHKVVSLGYCRRSVEAAWKRHQKMRAPEVEAEPEIDVSSRLEALARALPREMDGRDSWAERLAALEGSPETVEARLRTLDAEILEAVMTGLGAQDREAVERELESALEKLASRLPSQELEGVREQLRERHLRERLGLPVLSLFAPEAVPGEGL